MMKFKSFVLPDYATKTAGGYVGFDYFCLSDEIRVK